MPRARKRLHIRTRASCRAAIPPDRAWSGPHFRWRIFPDECRGMRSTIAGVRPGLYRTGIGAPQRTVAAAPSKAPGPTRPPQNSRAASERAPPPWVADSCAWCTGHASHSDDRTRARCASLASLRAFTVRRHERGCFETHTLKTHPCARRGEKGRLPRR